MDKTCVECGSSFDAKNIAAKRCSDKCRRIGFKKRNPGLKAAYSKKYRDRISKEAGVIPGVIRKFPKPQICVQCGGEFTSRNVVGYCCSHKCRLRFRAENPDAPLQKVVKVRYDKVCVECGQKFTAKTALATACSETCKTYHWRKLNPDKMRVIDHRFKSKHKDKIRRRTTIYIRNRYHAEPNYRLRRLLSAALLTAVKRQGYREKSSIGKLIGCSWVQLRLYLESMFREGMTWSNHGLAWQIDHVIPIASVDLSILDNQTKVCHYTNLQPLFSDENNFKRMRILQPLEYLRPGHKMPAPISIDS